MKKITGSFLVLLMIVLVGCSKDDGKTIKLKIYNNSSIHLDTVHALQNTASAGVTDICEYLNLGAGDYSNDRALYNPEYFGLYINLIKDTTVIKYINYYSPEGFLLDASTPAPLLYESYILELKMDTFIRDSIKAILRKGS